MLSNSVNSLLMLDSRHEFLDFLSTLILINHLSIKASFLCITRTVQKSVAIMPSLKDSVRRMMSKKKAKLPRSEGFSIDTDTASSRYSRPSVDIDDERPSLDSVSSVYSRMASSTVSPSPLNEVKHVVRQTNKRESWFDGVVDTSYRYQHQDLNDTVMEAYQQPIEKGAPRAESIRKTRRSFQATILSGQERASPFESSIGESRVQAIRSDTRSNAPVATAKSSEAQFTPETRLTATLDVIAEEDLALQGTKREIRRIKVLDVASTRNALLKAHEAFSVGSSTLQTPEEQGDRLQHAEANLNRTATANKDATRKLKELEQANRMVSISNPFTATKQRTHNEDAKIIAAWQNDRTQRDKIRTANWHIWKETHIHSFASVPLHRGATERDVLAHAKYQFEEDSDDERIEDIFDGNIDELLVAVQSLKGLSIATSTQLDHQNEVLDRTKRLADRVEDGLVSNEARLGRF
jgi:hypothetical protein